MLHHQVERIALGAVDHHLAHPLAALQQLLHPAGLSGVAEFAHPQGDAIAAQGLLKLGGTALGDHPPGLDDRQAIGQGIDLLEVVAAEQDRGALLPQLAQHLPDGGAALDVEAHRGLIEHQQLGRVEQAAGQIQPATHAAGVATAAAIDPVAHRQQLHQLGDAGIALTALEVIEVALELQQLTAGQDLVDRHLLGHVAEQVAHAPRFAQGIEAGDAHAAGIRGEQGGQDAQGGGLAGAVGAEQAVEAAGGHRQIEAVEGHHLGTLAAVGLAQVPQLQHRLLFVVRPLAHRHRRAGDQAANVGRAAEGQTRAWAWGRRASSSSRQRPKR